MRDFRQFTYGNCLNCNKEFTITYWKNKKYCCRNCKSNYLSQQKRYNPITRDNHIKKSVEAVAKWREKNAHKRKAHRVVEWAVKTGKIIKPKICPVCDNFGFIHSHHKDYSKPLEIEWMCSKCHGLEHRLCKV